MTTYVDGGKHVNFFQFQAAFGLRPVSAATALNPPRASMTAAVVSSSCVMRPPYSKILGFATPKFLDGRVNLNAPKFHTMAKLINDDLLATESARLIAVRKLYAGDNATKFAKDCGFTASQWNNFERGFAFSRNAAFRLRKVRPVISLDWIYWGDERGMPVALLQDLARAALTGKGSKRAVPRKLSSR